MGTFYSNVVSECYVAMISVIYVAYQTKRIVSTNLNQIHVVIMINLVNELLVKLSLLHLGQGAVPYTSTNKPGVKRGC